MKELLDWFSVERLEEIIERAEFWGHGAGYTPCEVIVLARIALAVKQAKPVCWAYTRDLPDLRKGHGVRIHGWGPNRRMMATPYQVQNSSPLYEVPPVEALPQPITVDLKDVDVDAVKQAFAKGMDRYSGAMLAIAGREDDPALQNFRTAMEGIGHIRRTLEETFGGLYGTHVDPDVLVECKEICDAICDAYRNAGNSPVIPDGWIPVSERMPEVGDIVLTAMGGVVNVGEMECSAANCRFFTSVISGRELPATHWMPLPAAPEAGA